MKTTEEIAKKFSAGKFSEIYQFLNDNIEWEIIGEKNLKGKDSVIEFCEQTAKYFAEMPNKFVMENVVVGRDLVVINVKPSSTNRTEN